MKKTTKLAAVLAVAVAPAFAANMENPLYTPIENGFYSKTSVGIMYKVTDSADALVLKGHDGATEFPIWRTYEDLGYGITDRLSANVQLGYTYNGDIDRKGLHLGRLGLNYRIFANANDIVWDVYADAHLGGIEKMTGTYSGTGFQYDSYTTGQYGIWLGTRVGKTWGNLTGSAFAEVGYLFPSDSTDITLSRTISTLPGSPIAQGNAVAKLESNTDWNIGTKWSYDFDSKLTAAFGFAWKHHDSHVVDTADVNATLPPAYAAYESAVSAALAAQFKGYDFEDTYDEFPITVSISKQLSDTVRVALYDEYTFDSADNGSQNGSDVKSEFGVRLNATF